MKCQIETVQDLKEKGQEQVEEEEIVQVQVVRDLVRIEEEVEVREEAWDLVEVLAGGAEEAAKWKYVQLLQMIMQRRWN